VAARILVSSGPNRTLRLAPHRAGSICDESSLTARGALAPDPRSMADLSVLLTGFGAFLDVAENPSGQLVSALAQDPPPGVQVTGMQLPVSFLRAPQEIDAALDGGSFDFLLSLGVHRGPSFRPEQVGRAVLHSEKADNDGVLGGDVETDGGQPLQTPFDLDAVDRVLATGLLEVTPSIDAGGYVCERVCRHIYRRGQALGIPALFLHVPPLAFASLPQQLPIVRAVLAELASQCRVSRVGPPTPFVAS
jgi:pyroglutamyl-peptidase